MEYAIWSLKLIKYFVSISANYLYIIIHNITGFRFPRLLLFPHFLCFFGEFKDHLLFENLTYLGIYALLILTSIGIISDYTVY